MLMFVGAFNILHIIVVLYHILDAFFLMLFPLINLTNLYMIEFQKRGLPHCHTLVWVAALDRIMIAAEVDKYISSELPDPQF